MKRALVVATMLVSGGCSWLLTKPLDSSYSPTHSAPPDCDDGNGPLVMDAIGALIDIGLFAFRARNHDVVDPLEIGLGGAWMAVDIASFVTGVVWTSRCRRAKALYNFDPATSEKRERAERLELERLRRDFETPPPDAGVDAGTDADAGVPPDAAVP